MSKIARLFVQRLEQLARREARRNALRNGLLEVKAIEIGGSLVRRYTPVFETSSLTGDREKDLAWVRRHFGGYLQPSPQPFDGIKVEATPAPLGPQSVSRRKSGSKGERLSDADHANRAYALSLIGQAGKAPLVSNIIAAIVLARTIERARVTLAAVTRAAAMPAPVIALHAPIIGFEQAIRRLIEVPGFAPGGDLKGIDGEYVYDDMTIAGDEGPGRTYVLLLGHLLRRVAGGNLQRRLLNALRRDYPVVAICEDAKGVPDEVSIAADINLIGGRLDYPFLVLMLEAIYGSNGRSALDRWTNAYDVHYLTIDDVVLAFRPGRSAPEVVAILASLTERNRIAARDGDSDEDEGDGSSTGSKTSRQKPGKANHDTSAAGQDSSSGGWRRDKPSGAEVIQPEPWSEDGSPPSLAIETLPGYGTAKTWALDLKADLDDYRASILPWSDMSSKLLLSGPPGTGKTTFARALCNSLQVPLVVSSVSTWLQGAHLSEVLNRMTRTFAEARAVAPAILFIDEIDGIGKRQPAEREYADYWNAVVNKALELLDGAVKGEGLIVVGATNRPEQIDEALKRSGRLETHIEIPKPDTATLAEIFRHHLGEDLKLLAAAAQETNKERPAIAELPSDTGGSLSQQTVLKGGSQ